MAEIAEGQGWLVPRTPDFVGLEPAHREFQAEHFRENRRCLLSGLRYLSGIPSMVASLKQGELYRLVLPEGRVLQKGKDGLFRGVFYGPGDSRIQAHAKFRKAYASIAKAAGAVGSQILLVSMAIQLNRVEQRVEGLFQELHNDRIAEIRSGVRQYETAFYIRDQERRIRAIEHAIQTLETGLSKTVLELRQRIQDLPKPVNRLGDNWWFQSKARTAEKKMAPALESFHAAIHGVANLAECYAVMEEPEASAEAVRGHLGNICSCGIEVAAQSARLVPTKPGQPHPEAPWREFEVVRSRCLASIEDGHRFAESGAVAVEFCPQDLKGEGHG